ncbi:UPF0149 family protein [Paludibacterium yongneupense]|uniref:YecA/YgfB family protein n=1 Tax=Paludibacterium yongneupense TaxID=400061 RepID=UPI00040E8CA0|nr:UPF0149 family protein [Paludibacterium yongneupense]
MNEQQFAADELTRLEQLLTPLAATGSTMRPDEVQGFFTALASGPDALDDGFWWGEILGDAPSFENQGDEAELRALLARLYAVVAAGLAAGQAPEPILYAGEDSEEPDFWPWCNAYLYALDVVPSDWFELADDEGFEELLLPVMALGGMFEEDGGEDLMSFSEQELSAFVDDLPQALLAIHDYWQAKKQAPSTQRRAGDKVGRNDPCPCGSGKKYKACCGKN